MKVRLIKNPKITGVANKFNKGSPMGEVIIGFDEGDMDSVYISELEVLINGKWISMKEAFKNHDLITDNYDTEFYEPMNDEERVRGYRLSRRDMAELEAQRYD